MPLNLMECLSTDTLVDLYLFAILRLPAKTHCHIWRKSIPFECELYVYVCEITVIKRSYTKICFCSLFIA